MPETPDHITSLTLLEQSLYGSKRLGQRKANLKLFEETFSGALGTDFWDYTNVGQNTVVEASIDPDYKELDRGHLRYEITDHLGNVRAVITDRKLPTQISTNLYYSPDIVSAQDYYAFGSQMPGRVFNSPDYRYGFQGQEKIDEIYGNGNYIDFTFRGYNPRLGRFFAVDPKAALMPGWSPYVAFKDNPLMYVDPDGQFPILSGLVGFGKGLFAKKENFEQKGTTRMGNALRSAWRHEKNSWKMTAGLFTADKDKSFGGKVWQITSRLTWELPQTVGGLLSSYGSNLFGQVENVDYESGATVSQMRGYFGAFTMGSYVIGDQTIAADPNNSLFQHEYGHYLQSQRSGYTYLFKYGIPSLVSAASNSYWGHNAHWTEQDANIRAKAYWEKTIPGYSGWDQGSNPIKQGSKIVNPKWWEFLPPMFPIGVTLLNLNKGR